MGTMVHAILEAAGPHQSESELFEHPVCWTTPDGIEVHGKIDYLNRDHGLLSDWKTSRWIKIANLPYGNHADQINVYRFLAENNDHYSLGSFKLLQIVYIDLTGPAKNSEHGGVVTYDVPIWSDDKANEFISVRALILQQAYDSGGMPPMVDRDGRWLCNYCPNEVKLVCKNTE